MLSYFFFNDTATPEIYTLSLHAALPIYVLDFADLFEAHCRFEETHFDRLLSHRAIEHRDEHAKLLLTLRLFADVLKDQDRAQNWEAFINIEDVLLKHIITFDLDFKA